MGDSGPLKSNRAHWSISSVLYSFSERWLACVLDMCSSLNLPVRMFSKFKITLEMTFLKCDIIIQKQVGIIWPSFCNLLVLELWIYLVVALTQTNILKLSKAFETSQDFQNIFSDILQSRSATPHVCNAFTLDYNYVLVLSIWAHVTTSSITNSVRSSNILSHSLNNPVKPKKCRHATSLLVSSFATPTAWV